MHGERATGHPGQAVDHGHVEQPRVVVLIRVGPALARRRRRAAQGDAVNSPGAGLRIRRWNDAGQRAAAAG